MNLDDLGQHHRTMLKRLIRSNPELKIGETITAMLDGCSRVSQLRHVRGMIESLCKEYLDVIEDASKVDKK